MESGAGRESNKDVVITATNVNNSIEYVSCSVSAFMKYLGCLNVNNIFGPIFKGTLLDMAFFSS